MLAVGKLLVAQAPDGDVPRRERLKVRRRVGERGQRLGDVGFDVNTDLVVGVHVLGEAVHVHDLLVAVRVDALGGELLQFVADADDQVGLVEGEVLVVVAHEADHAQGVGVAVGDDALAREGGRDRQVEALGEGHQFLGSAGAGDAVAGQHDRVAGFSEALDRALDLAGVRAGMVDGPRVERCLVAGGRLAFDVLGQGQVDRAGPFALGDVERLAEHLGDGCGRKDLRRPFGHRPVDRDQVDALVGFLKDAVQADMGCECHQRGTVGGGIGHAEQQVQRPRAQRGSAHAGPAGQSAVYVGHEGGAPLVAYEDEADR
jgi:hypothetical protein